MFIDIWDENNKAIKINKFSKDLITLSKRYDALYKYNYDYGIKTTSCCDYNIVTDYYKIEFHKSDNDISYKYWFSKTLDFAVLIDCFMFLLSDTFTYLFESEDIDFIKITAGKKVMFEYDNRE